MTIILLCQLLICFSLLILLLLFPGVAHEGTDAGLALFAEALFPYLLTYFILVSWLLKLSAAYPLQGKWLYVKLYALSAFGGFPTGAAMISQLVKQQELSKKDAQLLLGICHTPSPLFVIGFVGQDLLNDVSFSYTYLLLLHSVSLLVIFLLRTPAQKTKPIFYEASFTASVRESVPVILIVGSTIIFFTTVYAIITHLLQPLATPTMWLVLAGVLEMTNGLHVSSDLFSGNLRYFLCALLLTTQSISIHLQVIVLAKQQQLSVRTYVMVRLFYSLLIPSLYALLFLQK